MSNRFKLFFWLFFVLMLFSIVAVRLYGNELLPVRNIEIQSANAVLAIQQEPQWVLLDKVNECRDILKNSSPLEFVEKKKVLVKKQVELCVLNIETGEILRKRYWLEEEDIDRASSLRKNYRPNINNLPRFIPVDPNEDFEVITNWWNNWASDLSVEKIGENSNDIYVVIGNKFLLSNTYVVYLDERTGPKYSDIIFVSPYSEGVHDPEVVANGKKFIEEKVDQVFEELRQAGVMSLVYPGKLVVDTISKDFVRNILLVEQTDPDALLNKAITDKDKRRVVEKVLVRYGLNAERSYRYTISKAGAAGPAQIMASTGRLIFRTYTSANLFEDINLGRLDMVNAIKTEILVFDHHLSEVRDRAYRSGSRAKRIFDNLNEDLLNEVRAMAYNGGPGKYNVATGSLNTKARGATETKLFLEKLRVIRYLKLFEG